MDICLGFEVKSLGYQTSPTDTQQAPELSGAGEKDLKRRAYICGL